MSNAENEDERLARDWLVSLASHPDSVSRPSHDPPDYVIEGDIAVEVTRLTEGDERSLHSLEGVVTDVLIGLEPTGNGLSLCVFWVYEALRVFPKKKQMRQQIRDALIPYTKAYRMPAGIEDLRMPCGLSLRLVHIQPTVGPPTFKFGGYSGMSGTDVRGKLLKDLKRAVKKKSLAVSSRGNQYETWWLVLVDRVFDSDHFTFDGGNEGKRLLRDMKSMATRLADADGDSWSWSRIVILAPSDACRVHLIYSS